MTARRYQIVHRTEYDYSGEVTASFGHAHLVPRDNATQRRIGYQLDCEPNADEWHEHRDFFGNIASYFAIFTAHRHLAVISRAEVETTRPDAAVSELDRTGWEAARSELSHDVEARSFALSSPLVELSSDVAEYATPTFGRGRGLGEVIADLSARIHRDFEYLPGTTTVRTTLAEVLQKRRGVCQDFAHLAVGCLRSVGLPARYVSGYLDTGAPSGGPALIDGDASHAWAEVLVPGTGWVGVDPTNDQFVDSRYVITAWGRDYGDVPPLTGVILTDATHSAMRVRVDVTRLDKPDQP